jgi:hypothetical protein
MKKKIFNLALILFCLSLTGICAQQRKLISRETAQQACNKAFENLNKVSYRKTIEGKTSTQDENTLILTQKGFEEFIPPNKKRLLLETKPIRSTSSADKFFVTETVWIDGFKYSRDELTTNAWRKFVEELQPFQPQRFPPASDQNVKYFLTENADLNGQNANLYELVIETKLQQKDSRTGLINEIVKLFKAKFWIFKNDLLLRWEEEMDNDLWNLYRKTVRNVYNYEYNSNIRIEAPKIN